MGHAMLYLGKMANLLDADTTYHWYFLLEQERAILLFAAALGAIPWYDRAIAYLQAQAGRWAPVLEAAFLVMVLVVSMTYLAVDNYNPFLYFRF